MAKNWNIAQNNERAFWVDVYDHHLGYKPFSKIESLCFLFSQLKRFTLDYDYFLKARNLIDVGCGPTGVHQGTCLYNNEIEVIASDPLADLYQSLNKAFFPNRTWIKEVGEDVEVKYKNAFAIVHCSNVIDHVQDPSRLIKSLLSITSSGGVLLVNVHVLRGFYLPLKHILKYFDKNHPHHFSEGDLLSYFHDSGVYDYEITYRATILEDNPGFNFFTFLQKPNFKNFKRFISNILLYNVYVRYNKK